MNANPSRLTNVHVPADALHVFNPLMDVMNSADELHGVTELDSYIAMMGAVIAEASARLANALSQR